MKNKPLTSPNEIINQLEILRETPPRDPQAAARGRASFLNEAETLPQPVSMKRNWRLNLRSTQTKLLFRTLTIAIVFLGAVLGSGVITARAAQSSLPGEELYPVKIWIEDLRLTLARSNLERLNLHLEFASERLGELKTFGSANSSAQTDDLFSDLVGHIHAAEELLLSGEGGASQKDRLAELYDEIDGYNDAENPDNLELDSGGDANSSSESGEAESGSSFEDNEEAEDKPAEENESDLSTDSNSESGDSDDVEDSEDSTGTDGEDDPRGEESGNNGAGSEEPGDNEPEDDDD